MRIKCCNKCPDRWVKVDKNGKATRCDATCEKYRIEREQMDNLKAKINADNKATAILGESQILRNTKWHKSKHNNF